MNKKPEYEATEKAVRLFLKITSQIHKRENQIQKGAFGAEIIGIRKLSHIALRLLSYTDFLFRKFSP